jgi:hypothetical protein
MRLSSPSLAAASPALSMSQVLLCGALVTQIFGVRYMSMLGGFVFLGHQVGSFLGAWLGGKLYGATGNDDLVVDLANRVWACF